MKSLKFLLIVALFTMNYSQAQDTGAKYYWGIHASGDYAYRALLGNSSFGFKEFRDDSEIGIMGYHIGGRLGRNYSPKFGLETGLTFSRSGFAVKKQDFIFFPSSTQDDPSLPNGYSLTENYYYLSVPVVANFLLGENRLKFISSIGIAANFMLLEQQVSELYYPDKTNKNRSSNTGDYQRFNLTPHFAAGISYDLNEKLNVRVQPIFQFGLLKVHEGPVAEHVWSGGLNFGVYFDL